ncbi:amidohydrolase family protein [Adhaeribacter soli]|uniref:Amidohydrolase family protein n=1 Tax=Adhaeribacter soli TaxID=2607655 RepID=A0A5N1IRJ9_9BACT|nr:amidohydrolase family protein [Adhaeribacter soli]KAA9332627.1 amidohydrolase family protein [Adhaeribacter soli]
MKIINYHRCCSFLIVLAIIFQAFSAEAQKKKKKTAPLPKYDFHDSHFHLTNYIQEGITVQQYLEIMGNRVGRSTLFGIPLQQAWSYQNSGNFAPTYYLQSDAPLYYYSFTDAYIASVFNKLSPEEKQRFDPMITGFNPADMYGKAHIKRVLQTFPGVFSGIGEFSIHKEFVSSKVAGEVASLTNPALDSILDFAGEVGLAVILHSDMDIPFAKAGAEPVFLTQMKDLLKRHPKTTIIWAHVGMGRVVKPVQPSAVASMGEPNPTFLDIVINILEDPALKHVYFDISWDEVAKYMVNNPKSLQNGITVINHYPDRILFGTDVVAPSSPEMYYAVYNMYEPLIKGLSPEASEKLRKGNYERIFDEARKKVRAWEKANVK